MPTIKKTDRNLLQIGDERLLFNPGKMLLSETIAAEQAARMSWPQIVAGLNVGASSAIHVVVWLLRKRQQPRLKLTDVDFSMEDYTLLDPDYEPEFWVLTDPKDGDDDAVEVDASGVPLMGRETDDTEADTDLGKETGTTPEQSQDSPQD